ncbi:MAG: nucleoside 2-deoxyribosyltransferase, partial [Rhodospirillales bacterium]|nr:nucleoside 2-deoxyribosyltransferase [Rhodospirillales bacterium]
PSADAGTVYEVGFARALGLPVFGYACVGADLLARTRAAFGPSVAADAAEDWWDGDGLLVENFGLSENLMIAGGILASGGLLLAEDAPGSDRWRDLTVFERCVAAVAARLGVPSAAG